MSIIQVNLFKPGTQVAASPIIKNNTFPPGTYGFFSSYHFDNNWLEGILSKGTFVVTRRGKTGKRRFECVSIYWPAIHVNNEKYEHPIYNSDHGGIQKAYLEKVEPYIYNLFDLDNLDFLGWALSHVMYLKKLDATAKHPFLPKKKGFILNKINALRDRYWDDPDYYQDILANEDARVEVISSIRKAESQLMNASWNYMHELLHRRVSAANLIAARVKDNKDMDNAKDIAKQCLEIAGG